MHHCDCCHDYSDVYAFGIVAWKLLTRQAAFGGMHYGQVVERVVLQLERPPMPPDVPEDYQLRAD